jgi:hypothetical protein
MMRTMWASAAFVVTLAGLAGCGGGGHESFLDEITGTPNPNRTPGPSGDAAVIEFVIPDESATGGVTPAGSPVKFESSIGPVGSANPQASLVRFRVLNARGWPARNGTRVVFSVDGPADALLTATSGRTGDGIVETILLAGPTAGNATVVAQVEGTNIVARSAVIAIGRVRGEPIAIEFFGLRVPELFDAPDQSAAPPQTRTQLGLRGSGFNQAVDVVFALLDAGGAAAIDGVQVDFSLFGPNGGESVSPPTAVSAVGFVSTTIFTGTRPGPVQVEARVHGTGIVARAIPITIGTSLNPPASSLSVAARCLNVAGSVTFGLEDEIRAGLSDRFLNPIPIGSAVSFFTEGGVIQAQGVSADGFAATAKLVTQAPIPSDRRVTVVAVTTGQESFTDLNGNGQFDPGEPFVDLGAEPFVDANEDGTWQPGEFFIDANNNGQFDASPNGVWDDQILIAAAIPVIFSGRTVITVEPTTFAIPAGGAQVFSVTVSDDIGQPLVGGSTIKLSATNAQVFPTEIVIPDTNIDTTAGPVPGVTQFTVVLSAEGTPEPTPEPMPTGSTPAPKQASLTIEVESDVASGAACPGGNGNSVVTVLGTIG